VCDQCRHSVRSVTRPAAGACTYITCLLCCFLGMWPCYLYPFCIDSLKDVEHRCPICRNFLGSKKPCT
jgi:lipopolysaccharide-induced tumor necrosis factor-alpha factor